MRNKRMPLPMIALLALLLFGALCPSAQARPARHTAAAPACSGAIAGAVFASDTDMPLEGVTVIASLIDSTFAASALTDAAGHYSIAGLPPGLYAVQFAPDADTQAEYVAEYFGKQFDILTAALVTVEVGALTPNVNATLDVGGTISGQVRGADTAAGVSDVLVRITRGATVVDEVTTDAGGAYTSHALPSGSYRVSFTPPDGEPAYLPAAYAQQPGSAAALVRVAAPEPTDGIDATLGLGGQIRGRVVGDDAITGLADVAVEVYNSAGAVVASASTDADGYYASGGLRSGSYKLLFDPSGSDAANVYLPAYYSGRGDLGAADSVVVAAPTATVANTTLSKGGRFFGAITSSGGQALADVEVRVYTGAGELAATALSDEKGLYATPGLAPGSYALLFRPVGAGAAGNAFEYYSNRATLATADLLAAPSPGAQTQISAVLAAGSAISGHVALAGRGACSGALASAGVTVKVYDADGRTVAYTQPAADGSYATAALPPGSYRVGFEGSAWLGVLDEYYDNQLSLASAQPIVVGGPGAQPSVDAALVQGKVFLPVSAN